MSNSNLDGLVRRLVHPQQPLPHTPSHTPERMSVGSHHDLHNVLEPIPQLIPPPASASITKPVSHQPTPSENVGEMFPISVGIQQKKDEQQEKEKDPNKMSIDELASFASWCHRTLGQVVATLLSSCKNEKENSRKLRAEKEVLLVQLKESEDQTVSLRGKMEHLVKKCEEDVGKAKSEEEMYKNNYVKLSEQLTAIKKESLEKDTLLESSKEEINEQKAKVEAMNITEKELKEEVVKKNKAILLVEERYRKKSKQNARLVQDIFEIQALTTELQESVNNFVECDKKDKETIQNLETQIVNVSLSAEANISQKSEEISRISGDLEKARNDNKVKLAELEKQAREICDLKEKVKILQKEKDNFPTTFDEAWIHARNEILQRYSQKQRSSVTTASSSSETGSSEPTSMSVEVNQGNENGDKGTGTVQDDTVKTTAKSKGKKRRVDSLAKHDGPLGFDQISQMLFNKKLKKGNGSVDLEIPEVSSSSRNSNTSSSSKGKKRTSKQCSKQCSKLE